MHPMEVRHRSSVSVELRVDVLEHRPLSAHKKDSHQYPRVSAQIIVVGNSSRIRLRALYTLSVSSRTSCANLIVIFAIVTVAATRLAFLFHTTWSINFGRVASIRNFLLTSSSVWNRFASETPFIHLARCVRAKSMCFSMSVGTKKDGMSFI